MSRQQIPENGPIRYISKCDTAKPFKNKMQKKINLGLEEFYGLNTGNTHVIVYAHDENILALTMIRQENSYLYISTLEANQMSDLSQINAPALLLTYLDSVARYFDYKKIILDSLNAPRLIQWYEANGYRKTGNKSNNQLYGKLIEMEKSV